MKIFKEWIRIPGVIAAIVLALLMYFVGQIASGFMLKSALEDYGSEALGAKVDVNEASIGFLPPSIELNGLAFTDPDQPMQNMAEISQLKAKLNLYQLVVGRIVIDELNYKGLTFGTQRKTSGAIEKKVTSVEPEISEEPDFIDAAKNEIPDADAILAKEPLLSQELSEKLKASYSQCDSQWVELKKSLASSDEFKQWGEEIKTLTSGKIVDIADAEKRASRLKEIRNLLKTQSKNYKQAKEHLSACNKSIQNQISELKAAPKKDIDRLNEKYFSSEQGTLSNVTQLLFGDDVRNYIDTALEWYGKVQPVIKALSAEEASEPEPEVYGGEFIEFEERDRQASFSIRSMKGDAKLSFGQLAVTGQDLNAEQAFSQKHSVMSFTGDQLQGMQSITAKAVVNRIDPVAPKDDYQLTLKEYQLNDFVLSEGASLPLKLKHAVVDVKTQASYQAKGFESVTTATFTQAEFEVGDNASSTVKKVFASMQNDLASFSLIMELSDMDDDFKSSVNSDLDKIIGSGLKNALKNEIAAEKKKLKAKLQSQAQAALQEQLKGVDLLKGAESSVGKDGQGLDDLIESSLKDPLKQYQEQKEAELKAELDAKKKAEKDKLKDKLKSRFGF